VVGVGPLGISNGESPEDVVTRSIAAPKSEPKLEVGVEAPLASLDFDETPLIARTGTSPRGLVAAVTSGVTGGVGGRLDASAPLFGSFDIKRRPTLTAPSRRISCV
jgi:hypothetical protein